MKGWGCFAESTVAVFPSDHFIVEEELFMAHVYLACRVVERYPSYLVLLGIQPGAPEPDYGYIVPGPKANHLALLSIHGVSQFIEKPDAHAVQELLVKGGLWNSMVMVFKARTLLDLVRRTAPQIYRLFSWILQAVGTTGETDVVEEAYRQMEVVNFSRGLLEALPREYASRLLVLPVRGVHWSDWGSEHRIMSVLQNASYLGRMQGLPESSPCRIRQGFTSSDRLGGRLLWKMKQTSG